MDWIAKLNTVDTEPQPPQPPTPQRLNVAAIKERAEIPELDQEEPPPEQVEQEPGGLINITKAHGVRVKALRFYSLAALCPGRERTEKPTCYSTHNDYWLGGTVEHPHWICRICHPPAPGAGRTPENPAA